MKTPNALFVALSLVATLSPTVGAVPVDLSRFTEASRISVINDDGERLTATWPTENGGAGSLVLNLAEDGPLIQSLSIRSTAGNTSQKILAGVDPLFILTVGQRDLTRRNGWVIFFDKTHQRPSESYRADLDLNQVVVTSQSDRCSITLDSLKAGPFEGSLVFTIYAGSPLVHLEAVVSTSQNSRALLYDAGIAATDPSWQQTVWVDTNDQTQRADAIHPTAAKPERVRHRTIIAEAESGSVAIFPPPHQYFYPLDFSDNLGFVWQGTGYRGIEKAYGLGIRQPLDGDRRFVPWFNAPPGTQQRLSLFLQLSSANAETTLDRVLRYTRNDRFKRLPGHLTFSSHYHVEHTTDLVNQQPDPDHWTPDSIQIPAGLETPGFVRVFKTLGIDIVHLAEFHFGRTPRLPAAQRLPLLELMHNECERLSDDTFLLLPGEEPNVHLGGHWISFFDKPVYWVLNRNDGVPFVEDHSKYGKVYHVGNASEVLELFERENGLMWTAHPRIKSSTGFPDIYSDKPFYLSDRFLGGAWKAMPADLSYDRLGRRVLGLQDDMANWGQEKYILGEVDTFKTNPDHEQYAHMNVNYLRLDKLPRFADGWSSILDALRGGEFFVTTGEVLIPKFSVAGSLSGQRLKITNPAETAIEADLEWTFPLAFAELISGDGQNIYRQRIELAGTAEFGQLNLKTTADLRQRKWVRLEVWDIAKNGAFTAPVWIE